MFLFHSKFSGYANMRLLFNPPKIDNHLIKALFVIPILFILIQHNEINFMYSNYVNTVIVILENCNITTNGNSLFFVVRKWE